MTATPREFDDPGVDDDLILHGNALVFAGHTEDTLVIDEPARACRVCGCTDDAACWPPCHWVDTDLCSACEHL